MLFAGDDGKVAGAGEGVHHLYLKNQRGSFNAVTPSNADEAAEAKASLERIHGGSAPRADSELMKYLASFTPMQTGAVETKAGSLSFPSASGIPDSPIVFVRENDKEMLAVEVWGERHAIKIGIFRKK
jgi:hypothetical protein